MKRVAVCPGSYDPITKGHEDVIRRAAKLFGECIVLVMDNREKTYRFTPEERVALCECAFEGEEKIRVMYDAGMLYEFLLRQENAVLVKGIRNETDYLYERKMAEFNYEKSGVETLYLDAREEYRSVSSTVVREKISKNEALSCLIPEKCVGLLHKIL